MRIFVAKRNTMCKNGESIKNEYTKAKYALK